MTFIWRVTHGYVYQGAGSPSDQEKQCAKSLPSLSDESVNQIDDAIGSSDVRQHKQFLTDKLTVLSKLDDEVLQLTEDGDLDAEVEQAR